MNKANLATTISTATLEQIYDHLLKCKDNYQPPLDTYTAIPEYAQKLKQNATTFETWSETQLIGLIACYFNTQKKEGYITNVSILKEYQGRRIASHLIEETLQHSYKTGIKTIKLHANNQKAIQFYEKHGFTVESNEYNRALMSKKLESQITVSICCVTYNHGEYIKQALDSFLAQKTRFNIEILIHDDASTDNTPQIIKKIEEKYPTIIKPIYQKENQLSKGIPISNTFNFPRARGKYIALCEGDDYWTDPYKLQKQVDFLEANPEYNLTCHRYQTYNETTKTLTEDGNEDCFTAGNEDGLTFDALYIFRRWISKTLTVVFRNDHNYSSLLSQYQYARDVHLFYHILKNGKGFFFPFIGGVYRVHDGGVFSASSQMDKLTKGSLIFREIAEKNPDFQPVYQGHIDNVINKIDGNIFAHRFPFLKKENYILIHHLYSVCNKRKTAVHRFGKLFYTLPGKIIRKIKSLLRFPPLAPSPSSNH